jgi:hypothetical protein
VVVLAFGHRQRRGAVEADREQLARPVEREPDVVDPVEQPGDAPGRLAGERHLLVERVTPGAVPAGLGYPCRVREERRTRVPGRRTDAERVVGQPGRLPATQRQHTELGLVRGVRLGPTGAAAGPLPVHAGERHPAAVRRDPRRAVAPAVGELAGIGLAGHVDEPQLARVVVGVGVDALPRDDRPAAVGGHAQRAGQP